MKQSINISEIDFCIKDLYYLFTAEIKSVSYNIFSTNFSIFTQFFWVFEEILNELRWLVRLREIENVQSRQ